MSLINSLDICQGLITRSRIVCDKKEDSVIDFALACDKLLPFVTKMVIDEQKMFSLSNFSSKNRIVHSDHNSLILDMKLRTQKEINEDKIIFNYKNQSLFDKFKEITSNSSKFSDCFSGDLPFEQQIASWTKVLRRSIYKCFQKIKIRKLKGPSCETFKK